MYIKLGDLTLLTLVIYCSYFVQHTGRKQA